MYKLSIFIVSLVIFQAVLADKVKVDVFYEALCPDSKDFIVTQLFPLYSDPEFKDRLDITLVPFGKASFKEVNGELQFTCQHGVNECISNTYLSCSIKMNTFDQAIRYTHCVMSEKMPAENLETCATKLSLNYAELTACKEDKTRGPQYLKMMGEKTVQSMQKIGVNSGKLKFVPTILLNDKLNREEFPKILTNFKEVVCSKLEDKPKSC